MNNEYKQKDRQLSDTVRLPPGLYVINYRGTSRPQTETKQSERSAGTKKIITPPTPTPTPAPARLRYLSERASHAIRECAAILYSLIVCCCGKKKTEM